jgi:hypothetical protein
MAGMQVRLILKPDVCVREGCRQRLYDGLGDRAFSHGEVLPWIEGEFVHHRLPQRHPGRKGCGGRTSSP